MKTIKLLTLAMAVLALPAIATQYKFVAMDASSATKICIHAGENQVFKLKRAIRYYERGMHQYVANEIVCNELPIAQFSAQYGAAKTTKFLNQYAKSKNKGSVPTVEITDLAKHDDEVIVIKVGTAPH
ncbi:DUF3718 domain-containing protein [Thalassotalea agarivorans]|uniref:DUF3718 domain-containing protein n=1 Tax=Thalassotalea agarivorans TaxID=349064 RepID=A0A1I0CE74_THASX|nr:DUF3718 domain-containing protein [Thalassotalea agarivorans]SET17682.1 Protein of unknown function [Thalassotalea agarivorans]